MTIRKGQRMKNINQVIIAGNITADAKTPNQNVCTFSVAVNSSKKNGSEYVDYPNFINCVVFGAFGQTMAQYLKKGLKVMVQGQLHQERWQAEDGSNRSSVSVYVDNIEMAPKAKPTPAITSATLTQEYNPMFQ